MLHGSNHLITKCDTQHIHTYTQSLSFYFLEVFTYLFAKHLINKIYQFFTIQKYTDFIQAHQPL